MLKAILVDWKRYPVAIHFTEKNAESILQHLPTNCEHELCRVQTIAYTRMTRKIVSAKYIGLYMESGVACSVDQLPVHQAGIQQLGKRSSIHNVSLIYLGKHVAR